MEERTGGKLKHIIVDPKRLGNEFIGMGEDAGGPIICFWVSLSVAAVCIFGEGNGNPLQCSCLENPRDSGAWWAAICGVAQSDVTDATQQQQQRVFVTATPSVRLTLSFPH